MDSGAIRASIESRGLRDPGLVPLLIRSFHQFHSAHSVPLDFATKYGVPAALLIVAAQIAILWGYLRRFGMGIEAHLVLLSSYRFPFSDPSRPSMALLFVQASYLALARGAPRGISPPPAPAPAAPQAPERAPPPPAPAGSGTR